MLWFQFPRSCQSGGKECAWINNYNPRSRDHSDKSSHMLESVLSVDGAFFMSFHSNNIMR